MSCIEEHSERFTWRLASLKNIDSIEFSTFRPALFLLFQKTQIKKRSFGVHTEKNAKSYRIVSFLLCSP